MSDCEDFDVDLTPVTEENTDTATEPVLTEKSKAKYSIVYEQFLDWKNKHKFKSITESVLMAYFIDLAEKYQPSTLWSKYSMLKTMLKTKDDIDIKEYSSLSAFLKRQAKGFRSKSAKVLTADNIEKFINEAPDDHYLATKVALIFGICGGCRRVELTNITVNDIETHGNMMLVKVPNEKNKIPRSFTIDGSFFEIVKKYESQRASKCKSDRFFQNYQKGKCTTQVIGVNKFGSMPKEIAKYLKLPDAESYTGHTFRRTSATLLADSGVDIKTLKRHASWKSKSVVEEETEETIDIKVKVERTSPEPIATETQPSPSFKLINPDPLDTEDPERSQTPTYELVNSLNQTINLPAKANITMNNCTNCTVNYYLARE